MKNTGFFQEDASLFSRYWETFAREHEMLPEERLLLAVLVNGIRAYRLYLFTQSRFFLEAESWLFGDEEDAFSFASICDVLGLNTEAIRATLLKWKRTRQPPEAGRKTDARQARPALVADFSTDEKQAAHSPRDQRTLRILGRRDAA